MPQRFLNPAVKVRLGQEENSFLEKTVKHWGAEYSFGVRSVLILALSFTDCVSLGKLHKISETHPLSVQWVQYYLPTDCKKA